VHTAYLEAGADCITSAGYQASAGGFTAVGLDRTEARAMLRRAVEIAVEAKTSFWSDPANRVGRLEPIVAASAGPYGALLADGSEYDGRYGVSRDTLRAFHGERLDVLGGTSADVVAFETIPALLEAEAIAALLRERPDVSAWVSFSCRDESALWDGTPVDEAVRALASAESLVGVGVNCTAPQHVRGLIDKIAATTDRPVIVYPNSGEGYDAHTRSWAGRPTEWLDRVGEWVDAGARVLGGCCRVGPDEISELRLRLEKIHAL
jgi:homocysteine S-methyltransferase